MIVYEQNPFLWTETFKECGILYILTKKPKLKIKPKTEFLK